MTLAFWLCTGLAALTKGPAALCLPVYALIAAPFLGGSWRASRRFFGWWGAPLSLLMLGAWVWAAWRIDPAHVRDELWYAEIFGRVTGLGPEGTRIGPMSMLLRLFDMPLYFLARFLPWSILAIVAIIALWQREKGTAERRWRGLGGPGGRCGRCLQGAALFTIIVVAMYTFTAGKRADYVKYLSYL